MKTSVLVFLILFSVTANAQTTPNSQCKEPTVPQFTAGMKVVAQWQGNNWWVGKIEAVKGEFIEIVYSDNTKGIKKAPEVLPHPEVLYPNNVTPCFKAGDTVISTWRGESWWKATIDKTTADIAEITFADGEKGIHKFVEMVRFPAGH